MNPFDLTGRVIVITGGLGQLGRAFGLDLLRAGARLVALDSRCDDEAAIISAFGADAPGRADALFLAADVTDRSSLEGALEAVRGKFGEPFGLINNAAIDSPPDAPAEETGPFETYPEASFDQIMSVNVKGVVLASQVFGAAMADAGRGSIINISSIYGDLSPDQRIYDFRRQETGVPFFKPVSYSVSKSALFNLTRYLAVYWADKGVRVNTLKLAGVFNNQPAPFLAEYHQKVPLGRMADPDEYNGAVRFLMSDAASYMTGSVMTLDGGYSAW